MTFQTREGGQVPGLGAYAPGPPPFASLTFALPKKAALRRNPFATIATHSLDFGVAQTEPSTGFAYPDQFCVLTKKHCPQLAGVGVRAKRVLGLKNINVYTVGLYVDGHGARKALHKYKGSDVDTIMSSQKIFDDLVHNTHFEKSLRLVISYGALKRSQFLNALEERLQPELQKAKEPQSTMKTFQSWFDNVTFKKGMEIGFANHHKGQIIAQIDGKQVGSVNSPALVKALFDIYIGRDPVSMDAKKSIGQGLELLLNE